MLVWQHGSENILFTVSGSFISRQHGPNPCGHTFMLHCAGFPLPSKLSSFPSKVLFHFSKFKNKYYF